MQKKSNKYILFTIIAAAVILAFFLYINSFNVNGDFISEILKSDNITTVEIKKIDTRTDDIKEQKILDDEETKKLADYIKSNKFIKINSDSIRYDSKEGYLLEARDKDENKRLVIKSYGDEFITGHISSPNSPTKSFKMKITDENWLKFMEIFSAK